jgi:hypothetical protein
MPDPQRKWWQFWKTVPYDVCGVDGAETGFVTFGGYQPKGEQIDWSKLKYPTTDDTIDADR